MGRRQQCLIRFKKLMVEGNDNGCEESLFRTSMRGMEKFEKHVIYWLKTICQCFPTPIQCLMHEYAIIEKIELNIS